MMFAAAAAGVVVTMVFAMALALMGPNVYNRILWDVVGDAHCYLRFC